MGQLSSQDRSNSQDKQEITVLTVDPNEHTLLKELPAYCNKNTQHFVYDLAEAVIYKLEVVVIGILKEDFGHYCESNGLKLTSDIIDTHSIDRKSKELIIHG